MLSLVYVLIWSVITLWDDVNRHYLRKCLVYFASSVLQSNALHKVWACFRSTMDKELSGNTNTDYGKQKLFLSQSNYKLTWILHITRVAND